MVVTKIDGTADRRFLTAMVVSTTYLRDVREMYAPELLSAGYARTVAGWCLKHFARYGSAPGKHVEDIFRGEIKSKRLPKDQVELIQSFLVGISSEYVKAGGEAGLNIPFLLDETLRWFKSRDLQVLRDELDAAIERGDDPTEVEDLIRQRRRIEKVQAGGFEPYKDEARIAAMFEAPAEPLFHMPGAAGALLDHAFTREQLIGVEAPEKSGKTFLLTDIEQHAGMGRCNVARFEFGDLTESQLMRRSYAALTGKPTNRRWTNDKVVCVGDCWFCQTGQCTVKGGPRQAPIRNDGDMSVPIAPEGYTPCPHIERCHTAHHTITRALRRHEQVMQREDVEKIRETMLRRLGNSRLMVHTAPSKTMTIADVEEQLERWKVTLGFVPDVIVGDYADIMAQEPHTSNERESQNLRWAGWRRISQIWHCLCVVATQANADARGKENLGRHSWSEDKRKDAHMTGKLAIHRTIQEEELGLSRIGWTLGREEEFGMMDQVVLVQHLRICRPMSFTFWRDAQYKPKELIYAGVGDEESDEE